MRTRFPYVAMDVPLAAMREGVRCSDLESRGDAGKTHASAPESTRKNLRVVRSQIVIVFGVWMPTAVTVSGRPCRFPKQDLLKKKKKKRKNPAEVEQVAPAS